MVSKNIQPQSESEKNEGYRQSPDLNSKIQKIYVEPLNLFVFF